MGIEQEVEMKNVKEKHEAMRNSRSFGEKKKLPHNDIKWAEKKRWL